MLIQFNVKALPRPVTVELIMQANSGSHMFPILFQYSRIVDDSPSNSSETRKERCRYRVALLVDCVTPLPSATAYLTAPLRSYTLHSGAATTLNLKISHFISIAATNVISLV